VLELRLVVRVLMYYRHLCHPHAAAASLVLSAIYYLNLLQRVA
jgi:hypothetical protein